MNPWPLGDLQTDITMQWVINSRGLGNSLNPLDHPWNFDSAMVAKHRLRAVTQADRNACGDGKWVEKCHGGLYEIWVGHDMVGYELKKPRYRWEVRR